MCLRAATTPAPALSPCHSRGPDQPGTSQGVTAEPFTCKCFSFSPSFSLCLRPTAKLPARPGCRELKPCLHLAGQAAPTARGNPQRALFLQVCLQPTKSFRVTRAGMGRKDEGEETPGGITLPG